MVVLVDVIAGFVVLGGLHSLFLLGLLHSILLYYTRSLQLIVQINMLAQKDKPEVSVDSIKDIVKRYKNQGIEALNNHDLAVAVTTIGFREVCKEFGGLWTDNSQKQAVSRLANSEYDLRWYGKINNQSYLPFLQLCMRGDIEKVKEFIFTLGKDAKGQLITLTDNFKRSALHLTVREGFDVLAQFLIKEGFPVAGRDRQLKTPLHYCKNELICQLLLKKGAAVTAKDNKNCTPAHYAASGSEFKVLEMLLKKTNVVNEADCTGKTPLFYAIYNSSEEQVNVLRTLIENGAKLNQKDMAGKTALHYASEMGKARCIPFLLQKGANIEITDNHNKTPMELAANEKIKKIITAYSENKGSIHENQQKEKRAEFSKISNQSKMKENQSKLPSKDRDSASKVSSQIYTKQVNQVSTWVREKFFVLLKKLQESGIKALWHLKRPYIYTGSWAEDIQSLEELYESFLNINGPEAAMRAFNILCPFEKPLPNVLGKSEQAFQSFFGENWFSNDPVEKIRNMHSQTKIRSELELKIKQNEDLKSELLGYRSEIEKLEGTVMGLKSELAHYEKIEEDLRKERTKNTQQYAEILKHLGQISSLKKQIADLSNGEEMTETLTKTVQQLRSKNQDLLKEMDTIKTNEAAARRKCGQIFLKSLSLAKSGEQVVSEQDENNLYDDDAIISLYDLLKDNPPNLEKRFKQADRRGTGKLNVEEFTKMLEGLSMLPQDVMSMHRITGFAFGRKTLSLQEFKTLLENRHKNRPMWEKQLIRKLKNIILAQNITLEKLFLLIDEDGSGTIEASELRKGLESFNIFMNQSDWSNLFNLLDSDKSGTIDIQEIKELFQRENTGKLDAIGSQIKKKEQEEEQEEKEKEQEQKDESQSRKENQDQEQEQSKSHLQEEEPQHNQDKESEHQSQEQNEQNEQERSQNKLLSEQNQSEYQEQDQEAQIEKLNGEIKVQIPKLHLNDEELSKVWIKLVINEQQAIKMADLTRDKLAIVVKFEMIDYKILSKADVKLSLVVSQERNDLEQNKYIGEATVELQQIFEKASQWGVNNSFKLEPQSGEQEQCGDIVVQVKWTPKQE